MLTTPRPAPCCWPSIRSPSSRVRGDHAVRAARPRRANSAAVRHSGTHQRSHAVVIETLEKARQKTRETYCRTIPRPGRVQREGRADALLGALQGGKDDLQGPGVVILARRASEVERRPRLRIGLRKARFHAHLCSSPVIDHRESQVAACSSPVEHMSSLEWGRRAATCRTGWNIGLIVGPSGCGKSTIARHLFPTRWLGRHRG